MTDRELVLGVLANHISFSSPPQTVPQTTPPSAPPIDPSTAPTPSTLATACPLPSRRPTRDAVIYASNNIGIPSQLIGHISI